MAAAVGAATVAVIEPCICVNVVRRGGDGPEGIVPMWIKPAPLTADEQADLRRRIEVALEEQVRPGLHADGGDVEIVGVDPDAIVQVRLLGACQGCPSSLMTMVFGIEATLKERVPEIRFLEAVP